MNGRAELQAKIDKARSNYIYEHNKLIEAVKAAEELETVPVYQRNDVWHAEYSTYTWAAGDHATNMYVAQKVHASLSISLKAGYTTGDYSTAAGVSATGKRGFSDIAVT